MTTFNDLSLSRTLLGTLEETGLVTPTPIQAQAIPFVLDGRDLVGIAQTGTGKTAAFALPILDRLRPKKHKRTAKSCRTLVLSPTRELSGQIVDSFRRFGAKLDLRVELVIGGVSINNQIRALRNGCDVLVATPGRLLDLVKRGALDLDAVEILVLDEADQMLDMGFIHDIRAIMTYLPQDRQTLLFSATMPKAIADLSRQFLSDPAEVSVTPVAKTADKIAQTVEHVAKANKPARLAEILSDPAIDRALVFTRTKHGADRLVRGLDKAGIHAAAIHGNKSQNQRDRTLKAFRTGGITALIATDIAARGLDIPGVSHVVNYELPEVPEAYVHRIGRTARAGADGIAVALCDPAERALLRGIERLIRMPITVSGDEPGDAPEDRAAAPQRRRRRRKPAGKQAGERAGDTAGDTGRTSRKGPGRKKAASDTARARKASRPRRRTGRSAEADLDTVSFLHG